MNWFWRLLGWTMMEKIEDEPDGKDVTRVWFKVNGYDRDNVYHSAVMSQLFNRGFSLKV